MITESAEELVELSFLLQIYLLALKIPVLAGRKICPPSPETRCRIEHWFLEEDCSPKRIAFILHNSCQFDEVKLRVR
jgi:hypothetical protein